MENTLATRVPSSTRILVVDDEHVIADTLAIILRRSGFEAAVAYDAVTAIEKARDWQPDLLLSDVVMPDTDGIEAASRILGFLPRCCMLLIAGQAGVVAAVTDAAQTREHSFPVLAKPVRPSELLDRIRRMLAARNRDAPA